MCRNTEDSLKTSAELSCNCRYIHLIGIRSQTDVVTSIAMVIVPHKRKRAIWQIANRISHFAHPNSAVCNQNTMTSEESRCCLRQNSKAGGKKKKVLFCFRFSPLRMLGRRRSSDTAASALHREHTSANKPRRQISHTHPNA